MALTVAEIKDLIIFGRNLGLGLLRAEGVEVVYGPAPIEMPTASSEREPDQNASGIPAEFRHYSAQGRMALGRAP